MLSETLSFHGLAVLIFLSPVLLTTSMDMKSSHSSMLRHLLWESTSNILADSSPTTNSSTVTSNRNNTVTNVTVQLGNTAYLPCGINVADSSSKEGHVSWVRRRDWHILSSGLLTFTNDERFQILHPEGPDDWTLQIKYVQKRDDGVYECQVSNGTQLISRFVNLEIVVPEASIQGSSERHVDVGSVINLICMIDKSPTPPQYVFWFHNSRMINYDASRAGIKVETEPGVRTQSQLTIHDASDFDSGNYTCTASNTEAASIYVFVQEGDKMASLRRKTSNSNQIKQEISFTIIIFIISIILR